MAAVINEILKGYHRIFHLNSDPRSHGWPLASSPLLVLALVVVYVKFVTRWGPAFMKKRKPFVLDKIIQAYNVFQIIACSYIVYVIFTYGFGPSGGYQFWCEPVDYEINESSERAIKFTYVYYLVKVSDLLDTIFFVLRKKSSQVTLLHVYHHVAMVIGSWLAFRYLAGGSTTMVGMVNSAVHVFMYSYYFLTSWNPKLRNNLWWKKYITQIQIAQFLFFCVYSIKLLVSPSCGYPTGAVIFFLPQNLLVFILFVDFYRKAYLTKKTEEVKR